MLKLNVSRVFRLRGVENPARHLLKLGISRPTISRLLNNDKSWVSYAHLEKICTLLNCTPNDLFEWKPSADANLPENHALYALRRSESGKSLKEFVKDLPLEEVEKLMSEPRG